MNHIQLYQTIYIYIYISFVSWIPLALLGPGDHPRAPPPFPLHPGWSLLVLGDELQHHQCSQPLCNGAIENTGGSKKTQGFAGGGNWGIGC